MSASIVFHNQEDIALADMLAEHSVLQYSISYLGVHQYRHTSRLECSQHRVHHISRHSYVRNRSSQCTMVYNHSFSHHRSHYGCRHAYWAQLAPIVDWLLCTSSNVTHTETQAHLASGALSVADVGTFERLQSAYRMGYGESYKLHPKHAAMDGPYGSTEPNQRLSGRYMCTVDRSTP